MSADHLLTVNFLLSERQRYISWSGDFHYPQIMNSHSGHTQAFCDTVQQHEVTYPGNTTGAYHTPYTSDGNHLRSGRHEDSSTVRCGYPDNYKSTRTTSECREQRSPMENQEERECITKMAADTFMDFHLSTRLSSVTLQHRNEFNENQQSCSTEQAKVNIMSLPHMDDNYVNSRIRHWLTQKG